MFFFGQRENVTVNFIAGFLLTTGGSPLMSFLTWCTFEKPLEKNCLCREMNVCFVPHIQVDIQRSAQFNDQVFFFWGGQSMCVWGCDKLVSRACLV